MSRPFRVSRFFLRPIVSAVWGFRANGTDAIPASGPVIIASNHISNWDPVLISLGCRRDVHFMAKDELFRNPLAAAFFGAVNAIPIRRGVLDRRALRAASELLRGGNVLLMFPGGTRDKSGEVRDPKSGVGFIACMNKAPVVPACITGADSLARSFINGTRLEVTFGPPIAPSETGSSNGYRAFSQRIADEMGRLKLEVDGR